MNNYFSKKEIDYYLYQQVDTDLRKQVYKQVYKDLKIPTKNNSLK